MSGGGGDDIDDPCAGFIVPEGGIRQCGA